MSDTLLEVKNVKKYFKLKSGIFSRRRGWVKAVDDVSFSVKKGETFGLVGESGCGKSTVSRVILRLTQANSGQIIFDGEDILKLSNKEMREKRRLMQMVFQKPFESLNPRVTIGDIIGSPFEIHKAASRKEKKRKVQELLAYVGLEPRYINRYPHEFSGGQRQRIGIARAIALRPKLIICDEPISALDVSIQAQILNLLKDMQKDFGLSYIFISHNLSVVKYMSNRIAVMYMGKIVEIASKEELYKNNKHPYTKALLSAIPIPDIDIKKERILLKGDLPSPINPPEGCRFRTRCEYAMRICAQSYPALMDVGNNHFVACHLYHEAIKSG
ncbi:dipeptide ABC transporter ATP-binding protein [Petroclostridium sp. X23]|uniref:ABC transporter ATP-binding protein n=1 Tax=Petroclostridium sp. X23 TaxID=3045146 RepID=UPI0024ACD812|nr:dipeptide ABC transporter ATP-binding protein [Petroclostridium sp. X23]WHH60106.1 dipeptide ABC transporter ATP-binding protein [Petroclostridium sp. X23]